MNDESKGGGLEICKPAESIVVWSYFSGSNHVDFNVLKARVSCLMVENKVSSADCNKNSELFKDCKCLEGKSSDKIWINFQKWLTLKKNGKSQIKCGDVYCHLSIFWKHCTNIGNVNV